MPYLNTSIFQIVIDLFAKDLQIEEDKQILLILDQAPWHKAKELIVPKGIRIVYLPAYSPELQPAEHLWALSDQVLFNKNFKDFNELEEVFSEQCRYLEANPELVKNTTLFHWLEKLLIEIK
jgi:transposase